MNDTVLGLDSRNLAKPGVEVELDIVRRGRRQQVELGSSSDAEGCAGVLGLVQSGGNSLLVFDLVDGKLGRRNVVVKNCFDELVDEAALLLVCGLVMLSIAVEEMERVVLGSG